MFLGCFFFSSAECVLSVEFMCKWMCGAFGMHACNEIFRWEEGTLVLEISLSSVFLSPLSAGAWNYAFTEFSAQTSIVFLANIPAAASLNWDTHKLEEKGHPYIRCYCIEIELEDKEQGCAESCCCPQAWEHFLHYTSVSALFLSSLPAPSYCRRYQRHQLSFNLD